MNMDLRKMSMGVIYADANNVQAQRPRQNVHQFDAACAVNMDGPKMQVDVTYVAAMLHQLTVRMTNVHQAVECIVNMVSRKMQMAVIYVNVMSAH